MLSELVGEWSGSEAMSATQWTAAGEAWGSLVVRFGPVEAESLLIDYTQTIEGRVTLRAHGVVVGDAWWWFDSAGFASPEPGVAAWGEGALVLERVSVRGRNVTTLRRVGEGELEHAIDVAVPADGELSALLRGRYVRGAE